MIKNLGDRSNIQSKNRGFLSTHRGAGTLEIREFIEHIRTDPEFRGAFAHYRRLPPREPEFGSATRMHRDLEEALGAMGIDRLYRHQTEAIDLVQRGGNVIVTSPTASGKTLIYNLAVLNGILAAPETRALYLFPLKALAQDQLKALAPWLGALAGRGISAEIYDGDTSPYRRGKIRGEPPHILLTNPDMLHRGILAHHRKWDKFFKHLSFVVIDEAHTYRGIFGSHLTQILRRLKRICRLHGARPRFTLLSATISNPEVFGKTLIQDRVQVVDSTGAPAAARHFLFLNPGASPNFSSARLFADCITNGFRTIAFTQSRKVTELIHVWVSRLSPRFREKVSSYRAGFMPEERRLIEQRLARGEILGVVSTSALEMGIDIGHLDICLLVGYPGTIINTWQRGGRVGRSGRESLIIIVAKPDALDQYFMKHPGHLFERSFEAAVIDPDNPHVVEDHLPCAAAEHPLTLDDAAFWRRDLASRLDELEISGALQRTAEGRPAWYASSQRPHLLVDIRAAGGTFTIFEDKTGQAVGTVNGLRAFKECHPGAVYLHMARHYLVQDLILKSRDIVVSPAELKYFTRTRSEKETRILETHRSRPAGQFLVREGNIKVSETVTGYEKRALPGQELMGVFPLDLPTMEFETTGFWIEIEPAIKRHIEERGLNFMGGIHAIEHAAIGLFPLFALCDRNDIGGICYPFHEQVGKSAIFIYDAYPGGVGLAHRGFDIVAELLQETLDLLRGCECEDGCPSCIHSPKCGSGNKPLDKHAAMGILKGLLGHTPLGEMPGAGTEAPPAPTPREEGPDVNGDAGPRIVYLDLETRKTAREVGGWQNQHLMRVSVAVLFDTREDRDFAFTEERMDELIGHLESADLVVGFNIRGFDYKVLKAYTDHDLDALPTFDILEDVHRRLGFRLSLDHLASETLGTSKTADGLQAVEWFKQGDMEKLTSYCAHDVAVTRDIFRHGLENGHLVYREKHSGTRLRLRVDWDLDALLG